MIAAVERQAYLLFEKTLAYLYDNYKKEIKRGKNRPTKHKVMLKNGSVIHCLPAGLTGNNIRGYTINILIADEAAFIPEEVWTAMTPSLAMTGGKVWLLSTPHGREGYYYKCFQNPKFSKFHVRTPDVLDYPNRTKIQKEDLREHLTEAKKNKTRIEFAQEYLGEFIDELRQFFPDDLIDSRMYGKEGMTEFMGPRFLGVDIARMGDDETVFFEVTKSHPEHLYMDNIEIIRNSMLTETTRRILRLDRSRNFKKIYIDDGGMGVGVFDPLIEHEQTRDKVVGINNAKRCIEQEDYIIRNNKRKKITGKKTRLMKEALYYNLKNLMEKKMIFLHKNPELRQSLKSIQYEYTDDGRLKIFGKYDHIAEALVRAAWCMKDKSLNIFVA